MELMQSRIINFLNISQFYGISVYKFLLVNISSVLNYFRNYAEFHIMRLLSIISITKNFYNM